MSPKKQPLHDRWKDYTNEECMDILKNHCIKHNCPYLSSLRQRKAASTKKSLATLCCNYILVEGHSRGCMSDVCGYWKKKPSKKRHNQIPGSFFE